MMMKGFRWGFTGVYAALDTNPAGISEKLLIIKIFSKLYNFDTIVQPLPLQSKNATSQLNLKPKYSARHF